MITRAQAEALLTLAESLEACERTGIEVFQGDEGVFLSGKSLLENIGHSLSGMAIRLAVNALIPKQET